MSLNASLFSMIPDEIARVARAAFPKGNPSMRMRDALGPISTNPDCADRCLKDGTSAQALAQLALIPVMQCAENQSDRQAVDGVRAHRLEVCPGPRTNRPRL